MRGWQGWLDVVVIAAMLAAAAPVAAQEAPRIALIVTNQNYRLKELELKNTHLDGDVLRAALEAVGFKVWVKQDTPHRGALEEAVGEQVGRLAVAGPNAVGFFYYSGHGAGDGTNGRNYGSFDLKIGTNGWSGVLLPGESYLELSTGGLSWGGAAVLVAAVVVFVVSLMKYQPVAAVTAGGETKKPALVVRYDG